jgi:hypothetical protein
MEAEALKTGEVESVAGAHQEPASLVPPTWQIALIAIALAGVFLMLLMRQLSARRWK